MLCIAGIGFIKDAFFVDVGAIFDLGDPRPVQNLHLVPTGAGAGVNSLRGFNVHSLAIQVPIASLTASGTKRTDGETRRRVGRAAPPIVAAKQSVHARSASQHPTRHWRAVTVTRLYA